MRADEIALLAREGRQLGDLPRHRALLLEREGDGSDSVRELRLRCGYPGDGHWEIGIEEILDHHHRVVSFLDRLAVEVC